MLFVHDAKVYIFMQKILTPTFNFIFIVNYPDPDTFGVGLTWNSLLGQPDYSVNPLFFELRVCSNLHKQWKLPQTSSKEVGSGLSILS